MRRRVIALTVLVLALAGCSSHYAVNSATVTDPDKHPPKCLVVERYHENFPGSDTYWKREYCLKEKPTP